MPFYHLVVDITVFVLCLAYSTISIIIFIIFWHTLMCKEKTKTNLKLSTHIENILNTAIMNEFGDAS